MTILYVNTGSTANAGDGDSIRAAFTKINENFRFISTITVNSNTQYQNIIPLTSSTYIIGGTYTTFKSVYLNDSISLKGQLISVNTAGSLTYKGIPIGITSTAPTPPVDASTGTTWYDPTLGKLFIYYDDYWVDIGSGTGGGGSNLLTVNSDILPITDNIYDIGSTSTRFRSAHLGTALYLGTGTVTYNGILRVNGLPVDGPSGPTGPSGPQGLLGGLNYVVTASGVANFLVNGLPDPAVTLLRGFTYYFNVNAPATPFWIKTVPSTGTSFAYSSGVSNNGTDTGVIQFTVPDNAPSTLYYISQNYGNMQGVFNVITSSAAGPTGPSGPQGPALGFDQDLFTTSSVIFENLTVNGSSTFFGKALFLNTVTYVASTNTYVTDNLFDIHTPPENLGPSWTFDDGQDIGIRMHYWGAITSAYTGTLTVTNSGTSAWIIDGAINPPLDLISGYTYTFNVNSPGHPFYIKYTATPGSAGAYPNVTNNGTETGLVTFVAPYGIAPLYYVCGIHTSMNNTLTFIGDGNTGTTAALYIDNTTKYLEFKESGFETAGDFGGGEYGTFKAKHVKVTQTVEFGDTSVQTTAFTGSAVYATSAGYASTASTASVALSVQGGTVVGNVPVNNTNQLQVGYLAVPQVATNTNYTLQLTDQGKHVYSTTATVGQTVTIPDSVSVPFPLGTAVTIVLKGTGTIAISTGTGVSLYLAGSEDAPSNRLLSANGMATILKVENNTWFINGTGLT